MIWKYCCGGNDVVAATRLLLCARLGVTKVLKNVLILVLILRIGMLRVWIGLGAIFRDRSFPRRLREKLDRRTLGPGLLYIWP